MGEVPRSLFRLSAWAGCKGGCLQHIRALAADFDGHRKTVNGGPQPTGGHLLYFYGLLWERGRNSKFGALITSLAWSLVNIHVVVSSNDVYLRYSPVGCLARGTPAPLYSESSGSLNEESHICCLRMIVRWACRQLHDWGRELFRRSTGENKWGGRSKCTSGFRSISGT